MKDIKVLGSGCRSCQLTAELVQREAAALGLDVRLGIAEYLHGALDSEAFRPPELLRRMVADGKLGKKSGRGFYDWSE